MTKFSVNKQHLYEALVMLDGIIKPYPTLDCFKHVLIQNIDGMLHLTGADMESSITTFSKYKGKDVLVALPYHPLMKVISISSKWMDFFIKDETCTIATENSEFILPVFNHKDYPKPTVLKNSNIEFQFQENFIKSLKKSVDFVTQDELRAAMTKVCLDVKDSILTIVATDGHTLIFEEFEIIEKSDKQLLIPVKDIKSIPNAKGTFRANDKAFEIHCDEFVKRGKLFEGKYPDYKKVIPEPKDYVGKIGCNRMELLEALNRIKVINKSNSSQVELAVDKKLIVSSKEPLTNKKNVFIKIEASHSGDTEFFNVNRRYLDKVLNSLDGQVIHFNLTGRSKAIIISSDGHKRFLMPNIKSATE